MVKTDEINSIIVNDLATLRCQKCPQCQLVRYLY